MDRRFKVAFFIPAALLVAASLAQGGIPDCNIGNYPNLILDPQGTLATTYTVLSTSGPLNGATVELRFTVDGDAALCWCSTQVHPIISGVTNASGQVTFNVSGGGCADPAVVTGGIVCDVYVNNILCRRIGAVSPDVVQSTPGSCTVGLTDAVDFTGPLATNTFGFCYDLNSDGAVGLADAVAFTGPAANSHTCAE